MKVATFIKKLLPYADKDLIFSTRFNDIKKLAGPEPADDDDENIIKSGIYILSDYVEIYLEVDLYDN